MKKRTLTIASIAAVIALTGVGFATWDYTVAQTSDDASLRGDNDQIGIADVSNFVTSHTVTFNSDGGSPVSSQTISNGGYATVPTPAPTKTNYDFVHWYLSTGSDAVAFNFATTQITSSVTLVAKWDLAQVQYTVTFDADGGSAVTAQQVVANATATKPANPTKAGYEFLYWYLLPGDGSAEYVFATPVTEAITLKAKWVQLFTVTFMVDAVQYGEIQTIRSGGTATLPDNPTKQGYLFDKWVIGATTTEFTAAYVVNATLVINASFTQDAPYLWDGTNRIYFTDYEGSAAAYDELVAVTGYIDTEVVGAVYDGANSYPVTLAAGATAVLYAPGGEGQVDWTNDGHTYVVNENVVLVGDWAEAGNWVEGNSTIHLTYNPANIGELMLLGVSIEKDKTFKLYDFNWPHYRKCWENPALPYKYMLNETDTGQLNSYMKISSVFNMYFTLQLGGGVDPEAIVWIENAAPNAIKTIYFKGNKDGTANWHDAGAITYIHIWGAASGNSTWPGYIMPLADGSTEYNVYKYDSMLTNFIYMIITRRNPSDPNAEWGRLGSADITLPTDKGNSYLFETKNSSWAQYDILPAPVL